jgi:signal transduction histidine kinase
VADLPEAERAMMSIRGQRAIVLIPIFVGQVWWGIMLFGLIREDRSWHPTEIEALQVAASTLGAGIRRQRMEDQIRLHADELEQLVAQRTERIKELEAQRAQVDKLAALGQLAAGVAHEINNPIAGIKNAFLVLKDAIPADHTYYHFVGMIEREIERVANIVRQMYDLYRNDSLQEQAVSLDTLLEDLFHLLKPKLAQRRITLRRHTPSLTPPLRLVRRDVLQVLLNLVQNAVEASPDGATVVVHVAYEQDHVRISVSDQGYGISSDELPHIFEPFFSGQPKRKQGGMGLGLSVSYSLVHSMGGRIDVASRPNEGATFTVVLPLARTSQMTGHSEGEPPCFKNKPAF